MKGIWKFIIGLILIGLSYVLAICLNSFLTNGSFSFDSDLINNSNTFLIFGLLTAVIILKFLFDLLDNKNKKKKKSGISDKGKDEKDQIKYTDLVGIMMSSVSTIVNVISSVLIAFVAISLVVSSIMIAIITYISVIERTKEIGILRAIGASKNDISRVFNAETLIEGLTAGVLGILVTILLNIPINIMFFRLFISV